MKYYKKAMAGLYKVLAVVVAVCLALMIVITFIEVVRRYFFGQSYIWSAEFVQYLMVAIGFLGGAAAFKNYALVNLDLLTAKFPKRVQSLIDIINNTVILAFLIFLFRVSLKSITSATIAKQISVGLKCSMSIPFSVIPIGFGLMILFALEHYLDLIPKMLHPEKEAAE